MSATLPGLVLRPYADLSDVPRMLRVFTAGNEVDGVDERTSAAGLTNWLTHPSKGFNPADDLVFAEVDGEVVGYGWTFWVDTTDGLRAYVTRGHVHPAWRRRGVGTAILERNEARLRELSASARRGAAPGARLLRRRTAAGCGGPRHEPRLRAGALLLRDAAAHAR